MVCLGGVEQGSMQSMKNEVSDVFETNTYTTCAQGEQFPLNFLH